MSEDELAPNVTPSTTLPPISPFKKKNYPLTSTTKILVDDQVEVQAQFSTLNRKQTTKL